ncbi:ATP-binding protein [Coprobacter sp.]
MNNIFRFKPQKKISLLNPERQMKGQLTLFFGMCMGIGKTHLMLQEGIQLLKDGFDVVLANYNSHGNKETDLLAAQIEQIPLKNNGEIDLDYIFKRDPQIVLVDEMAYYNPDNSRHKHRHQDIEEMLDDGIHVYTTLSVLQLESKSYSIQESTGYHTTCTVPDILFELAEKVHYIDASPQEIAKRYLNKDIYLDEHLSEHYRKAFFSIKNLHLLQRLCKQMMAFRRNEKQRQYLYEHHMQEDTITGVKLLIAIDESPHMRSFIRRAKNLSHTLGVPLYVVYFDFSEQLPIKDQEQLNKNISMAYRLGAFVIRSTGEDWVSSMLDVIHIEKITHLIVERLPSEPMYKRFFIKNKLDRLISKCKDLDIYILANESILKRKKKFPKIDLSGFKTSIGSYFKSAFITISATLILNFFIESISETSSGYIFLIILALQSIYFSIGPILLSAILSAALYDTYFTTPYGIPSLSGPEDWLQFLMFLAIPFINIMLTTRLRKQEQQSRRREQISNAMFNLSKHLSTASGINSILEISTKAINDSFKLKCAFILKNNKGGLSNSVSLHSNFTLTERELKVAQWVFEKHKQAGKSTENYMYEERTFYPLNSLKMKMGVVVLEFKKLFNAEEELLWLTLKSQISNALEREYLNDMARQASVLSESDRLYKTLFNSISHELRIPVTSILSASETLKEIEQGISKDIGEEIYTAAQRLHRLIENLLSMSRLDSGRLSPHFDWYDIHDLINSVTGLLKNELKEYELSITIPDEMPLVRIDFGLIEQVLYNLLYNITVYVPSQTRIEIDFQHDGTNFNISITDYGKGFAPKDLPYIFNKFYRGESGITGGSGLGLSIVKGYIDIHKGRVEASNIPGKGANISIQIPSMLPLIENF